MAVSGPGEVLDRTGDGLELVLEDVLLVHGVPDPDLRTSKCLQEENFKFLLLNTTISKMHKNKLERNNVNSDPEENFTIVTDPGTFVGLTIESGSLDQIQN